MGGGGGDGGYAARQDQIEAGKQRAREALNAMFGVTANGSGPSRDAFVTPESGGFGGEADTSYTPAGFDQAGYDAALAAYRKQNSDAAANKAARDALYAKVRDDAFTTGRRDLDERAADAQRQLKFSLIRSGLTGSRQAIDEQAKFKRTLDRGLLDLGARADAAKADLMGSDEQTRLGLLQSIDSGTDQGSAISSALNQLKVNADKAAATAAGTSIGDLFANAGLFYDRRQRQLGGEAGRNFSNQNGLGSSFGSNYQGTITGT